MISRQETLHRSLILFCATAFVLVTCAARVDAQTSSRRSSGSTTIPVVSSELATQFSPLETDPLETYQSDPARVPVPTVQNPVQNSVQSFGSTPERRSLTEATSVAPVARVAQENLRESPMTRQIRSQLKSTRSFQTGTRSRPNRSRALYDIRQESKQEAPQTVEDLLIEMDRSSEKSRSPLIADSPPPLMSNPEPQTWETPETIEPAMNGQFNEEEATLSVMPSGAQNLAPVTDQIFESQSSTDLFSPQSAVSVSGAPNSPLDATPNDLSSFEIQAIKNHPTLNASVARILTARHEALQAGLRPNPSLGLFIDEAGNENDPGLWGAYLQRKHIRGNKLALGREIKNREANVLEVEFETQAIRIRTDVRTAFYKLLIAKEKMALMAKLYQTQQLAVAKSKQLFDAGETPRTDVLQTELQQQRTEVLLSQLESTQQNAWRELASVIGTPDLERREVDGDLNPIIEQVSFEECRTHILNHSPELQSANAEMDRIRTTIEREIAETIPDYQTQLTVGRDSTTNHFFTGLQVQIPLQICDQNQGNIAAAKSRLVAAQNDLERIKLDLSKRLSSEYRQYESALTKSNMYLNQLLPKSQQTLELLKQGYPTDVSFLQLSTAQQAVIDITLEYLDTLSLVWESRLKIEGLLLDDSLSR